MTPAREGQCAFSPDGRWLAYSSDESARFEIYVRSVRGENRTIQVSMDGGLEPEWSPKGDRLFYRQGTAMIAVDVVARDTLVLGARRTLFTGGWDLPSSDKSFLKTFAVAPDGEHFVMIRHEPEAIPDRINIVLNWFEQLNRLVPVERK